MLDLLKKLKDVGCVSVKAEFEAEGTRIEELMRLVDIARRVQVDVALKVGGCEAIKDLFEAKQFGVEYIIAPMVETPYALSKFIAAKNRVFTKNDQKDTKFLVNIETITAYQNIEKMMNLCAVELDGVVFGRVDFCGSVPMNKEDVNSPPILDYCKKVSKICKTKDTEFVVGGGISVDAIPFLKEVNNIRLDRFETRKIIFSNSMLKDSKAEKYLLDAVHFELLWLQNKSEYYGFIQAEDKNRLDLLNNRWKIL